MSAQVDMGDGVSEAGVYGSLNRVYVPRPAKRADRTSSMNGTMSLGWRPRSMISLPTTSAASSPRSHIGGKTIVTGRCTRQPTFFFFPFFFIHKFLLTKY